LKGGACEDWIIFLLGGVQRDTWVHQKNQGKKEPKSKNNTSLGESILEKEFRETWPKILVCWWGGGRMYQGGSVKKNKGD